MILIWYNNVISFSYNWSRFKLFNFSESDKYFFRTKGVVWNIIHKSFASATVKLCTIYT